MVCSLRDNNNICPCVDLKLRGSLAELHHHCPWLASAHSVRVDCAQKLLTAFTSEVAVSLMLNLFNAWDLGFTTVFEVSLLVAPVACMLLG